MRMCVTYKRMNILCLLLFEMTALWSSSASESCGFRKDCYFEESLIPLSWSLAQKRCQEKNSILPVIRNADQQMQLEEHMKTYSQRHFSIWTSGKKVINQGRTWINGKPMTKSENFTIFENQTHETHFLLDTRQLNTGLLLRSGDPSHSAWFICQYKGFECQDRNSVNLTNSCIKFKGYGNTSWLNASNECSAEGGNLAILEGQDPQLLLQYVRRNESHFTHRDNNSRYNFWIGLHRGPSWQWQFPKEGEYITYTKWQDPLPASGDCISINSAQGLWTIYDCNDKKVVICQREMDSKDNPIKTTPSATTLPSTRPTTGSTTTSHLTTTGQRQNTTFSTSKKNTIYIAVIAIGIVILIIIVVVLCLVRKKRKAADEVNQVHFIKGHESGTPRSPETNGHTNHTQSGNEGHVRDITRLNETPASAPQIYAEIAPISNPNDAANKGVLYASLDFAKNEEVTYAEPMKKKSNTETAEAEKTKADAQHKIGPMGDVYALPITNPSSPGTKPTEPRVYANLGV